MENKRELLAAPSLLSADFARMEEGIKKIEEAGADWVHLDVMDGHFVPNITFGPKMISDLRNLTSLPFDVHLMVDHPEEMVDQFIDAGSDWLTFHSEAVIHSHRLIQRIKDRGVRAGISIVPSTPVSAVMELLPFVDLILVMTVNPGFGGQSLIPEALEKTNDLAKLREEKGWNFLISVDGGINRSTAEAMRQSGTDVFVSGSAFFKAEDPREELSLIRLGE